MMALKFIAALAATLALVGCGEPKYTWTKQGKHDFNQDSQGCKDDIDKRIKASPRNFIVKDGAYYQGSSEWAQRTYNECLVALGYSPTGEMTKSMVANTTNSTMANTTNPAVPNATTPTVANTTNPSSLTVDKGALSGTLQKLTFFYSINPDCSLIGYPTVHVVRPPAHGMVTSEQGTDFTEYAKDNVRYECNRNRSPVTLIHYKSDAGYSGPDAVMLETIFPNGTLRTTTYNITVR